MWAFLATEVLFFGALIAAYFNYRIWFGAEFIAAARMTKVALGTANTAVLLTSSACMAMAVPRSRRLEARAAAVARATALSGSLHRDQGDRILAGISGASRPRAQFRFPALRRRRRDILHLLFLRDRSPRRPPPDRYLDRQLACVGDRQRAHPAAADRRRG